MHTIFTRISNGSAMLSSCLMGLLAVVALSSYILPVPTLDGHLTLNSVKVRMAKVPRFPIHKREVVFVNFNISADLTPLFTWNTKQLFLYLDAEYTNEQGVKNDVVIWDRIVRRKEDAVINVVAKNKYAFKDIGSSFKKASPAQYTLKYNIMPHVGALTYGEAAHTTEPVPFPDSESRIS